MSDSDRYRRDDDGTTKNLGVAYGKYYIGLRNLLISHAALKDDISRCRANRSKRSTK